MMPRFLWLFIALILVALHSSSIYAKAEEAVSVPLVQASAEVAEPLFSAQISALETQVDRYSKLVADGGWPVFKKGRKITAGATDARVRTLRDILAIMGDYQASGTPVASSDFYDSTLEEAVVNFQTRHGLKPDGVVGAATQAALAVSAEDRLAQLQVTLDKMRVVARADATSPASILVNIPAYTLYVLEGQKVLSTMKVIVGDVKNQTPIMENEITYLQFNPAWYVPTRIAAEEILPKIKQDPDFLSRSRFVLSRDGSPIDPNMVDWESYGPGNFPFRIVQRSGDGNALGKVKFHMPDSKAIYLHDTSKPQLFSEYDRALSHGCVRLEKPLELAQFLLKTSNQMSPEDAEKVYNESRQRRLELDAPVPVSIVYWTARVNLDTNQPYFFRDVYKREIGLIAAKKRVIKDTINVLEKN
jgi:murein L,D-transpeptidase YcbB/YkuD